ncbi:hypothetical protein Tco_0231215 [Tanacetum coccineum]
MAKSIAKYSIMTQEMVDSFSEAFYIPTEVHPTAPRRDKTIIQFRKVTEVHQPSEPVNVVDEAVRKELGDRLVRAATTVLALEVELGQVETMGCTSAQTRFEKVSKLSNDSLLARVLDLENTKTSQQIKIDSLERKVKKLERSKKSRSHGLKRLYKVGLTARIESSEEEDLSENASKQGRISAIDADANITLVSPFVNEEDVEMLDKDEDVVANAVVKEVNVNEETISTAPTTTATTVEEITLTQELQRMKSTTPKAKGVVIQEREQGISKRTQTSAQPHDKGKAKMIEPEKPLKMKDQIKLDEETAIRLQAKFDKEERIAREEAQNVEKSNIALIEE